MSISQFESKAWFIGTWKDDAVTDNIIKQIATLTTVEKGRKVKLKLGVDGLKITKSNVFFIKTLFDFIPLHDIFYMTVNHRHPMCLLIIIRDPVHKYTIVAFRLKSELITGTFVQNFRSMKRSAGQSNSAEFHKKEDGNWTLRERSSVNARRELNQLFITDTTTTTTTTVPTTTTTQINGGLFYKKSEKRGGSDKKPNIYDQTPYIPSNTIHTEVYTEDYNTKNGIIHNVGTQAVGRDDDTMSMSEVSDISSIKGEMEALSAELKEVKYLLEKSTGISTEEHYRMSHMKREPLNNNNESQAVNYNRYPEPVVVNRNAYGEFASTNGSVSVDVPDYRSFGVQTAPKAAQRSSTSSNGPEHLIAAKSQQSPIYYNGSDGVFIAQSEVDKNQHRIHSVRKGTDSLDSRVVRRAPEYRVARNSTGIEPEEGVVYSAEKEAKVTTLNYPNSSTLPLSRSRGSTTSTVLTGHPGYITSTKSGSLKTRSYGIPSVVERPIENIYSRPVLIRRDYVVGSVPRRRPHSMHYRPIDNGGYVYGSQIITQDDF